MEIKDIYIPVGRQIILFSSWYDELLDPRVFNINICNFKCLVWGTNETKPKQQVFTVTEKPLSGTLWGFCSQKPKKGNKYSTLVHITACPSSVIVFFSENRRIASSDLNSAPQKLQQVNARTTGTSFSFPLNMLWMFPWQIPPLTFQEKGLAEFWQSCDSTMQR